MNKKRTAINIIILVCYLLAIILAIIGIFKDTSIWECTWYDIILMLMILGQELKIRMLVEECRERQENE